MSNTELLSLSEAAKRFNIPVPTLRSAVQKGYIAGRKIGSQWVVELHSLELYVANRPKPGPKSPK